MPPYLHILLTLLCRHPLLLPLAYVVTSLLHMEQLSVLLVKELQLRVLNVLGPSRVQAILPLTLKIQVHLIQLDMPKRMKTIHTTKRILLCTTMTIISDSNNSSLTLSVDHLRGHRTMNGDHCRRQDLVMAVAISPSTTSSARCRL